jgi:hypothetical protein
MRLIKGSRVRYVGWDTSCGVPTGTLGVVSPPRERFLRSAGFIFVQWDNGVWCGCFRRELEKVEKVSAKG